MSTCKSRKSLVQVPLSRVSLCFALTFALVPTASAAGDISAPDAIVASGQAWSGVFLAPKMGTSVASAGDVNGDGYDDVLVGAPGWDAQGGVFDEGAAFVFLGGPGGVIGTDASSAHAVIQSSVARARFGTSVSSAGDVNGDGYDDIIVGAPLTDASGLSVSGAAYVFHGGPAGITANNEGDADAVLQSMQIEGHMGQSVACAGDVNGDGYDDVIVGADLYGAPFSPPIPNQGSGRQGAAFVFLGSANGVVGNVPSQANARLVAWTSGQPVQVNAEYGKHVAGAGDVNGDGYDDVIIGAPRWNQAKPWPGVTGQDPPEEGAAFVYLGSASGIVGHDPTDAHARIESGLLGAFLGSAVDSAGDVDDDGYADIIVGAAGYPAGDPLLGSEQGAVLVFHGGPAGITASGPADAQTLLQGSVLAEWVGQSVAGVGDHDGDGYADVLFGARVIPGNTSSEGAAYLFRGGPSGIAGNSLADAHLRILQPDGNAWLGASVSGAGDVDGDLRPDLIVGVPGYSVGQSSEGAAFLYLAGENAWADLGGASTGGAGQPALSGAGSLEPGTTADLTLDNAPPGARLLAWVSLAPSPFPALDGVVHAFPYSSQRLLVANGSGSLSASTTWPPGLPASTEVWFQFLVEDVSTPYGITLSNGVRATTP